MSCSLYSYRVAWHTVPLVCVRWRWGRDTVGVETKAL